MRILRIQNFTFVSLVMTWLPKVLTVYTRKARSDNQWPFSRLGSGQIECLEKIPIYSEVVIKYIDH